MTHMHIPEEDGWHNGKGMPSMLDKSGEGDGCSLMVNVIKDGAVCEEENIWLSPPSNSVNSIYVTYTI